ncbi:MAG: (d)CMP kinase [Hydrotalea sp.]|nr:(d)CMP kinase [Hydrotalea sp.]
MKKIIITIDGFSSCGKSTLAKALAKELNYIFIDSGAMYRAVTLYFIENNISLDNSNAVKEALQNIHLAFQFNQEKGKSDMLLNNRNVEEAIRSMEISNKVSEVAAHPLVRDFAVAQQQQMGLEKGIVMDGRDIGTTVFPQAELKIFVTADPQIRTERRYKELIEKNPTITLEEVRKNLETRDHIDSTREFSPLRKANDAIELNNSHLTREEQLQWAIDMAHKILNS